VSDITGWSVAQQAALVASRLPAGSLVNLGIGMPNSVAAAVHSDQDITFHCENGLIGYREREESEVIDPDIIDAASRPVSLISGAAVVGHDTSFAIARGGRLDVTVLGAFQVSAHGDLANWHVPGARVPAIGGAMDLATGAKSVIVMMKHLGRDGSLKIVDECDYPVTAFGCVDLIVSDLAVIRITPEALVVEEIAPGVSPEYLMAHTQPTLTFLNEQQPRERV
jgi:3-oxoacid CoA-transferase B subunit